MSDTPLQTAAAAPGVAPTVPQVDPNTMLAKTPDTSTVPKTVAQEKENFADAWALAPEGQAPVRTWVDPAARATPDGQYLDAWYDQAPTAAAPVHLDAGANASAIGDMVNQQQAAAPAVPAAPAEAPGPDGPYGHMSNSVNFFRNNPAGRNGRVDDYSGGPGNGGNGEGAGSGGGVGAGGDNF